MDIISTFFYISQGNMMLECHFRFYSDVPCVLASSRWCLVGLDVSAYLLIQLNFDSGS